MSIICIRWGWLRLNRLLALVREISNNNWRNLTFSFTSVQILENDFQIFISKAWSYRCLGECFIQIITNTENTFQIITILGIELLKIMYCEMRHSDGSDYGEYYNYGFCLLTQNITRLWKFWDYFCAFPRSSFGAKLKIFSSMLYISNELRRRSWNYWNFNWTNHSSYRS